MNDHPYNNSNSRFDAMWQSRLREKKEASSANYASVETAPNTWPPTWFSAGGDEPQEPEIVLPVADFVDAICDAYERGVESCQDQD